MGVSVEDGLNIARPSTEVEELLGIEEIAIIVTEGVVNDEEDRFGGIGLEELAEPGALGFSEEAGDAIDVEEGVEHDPGGVGGIDYGDEFSGGVLFR